MILIQVYTRSKIKERRKKEKEIGKIKLNIKIIFKAIYGFKRKRNRLIKI